MFAESNPNIEDTAVWSKYDEFKRCYDDYLQQCIGGIEEMDNPLGHLVSEARRLVDIDADSSGPTHWAGINVSRFVGIKKSQQQIPKVLAVIFAWWTIDFYLRLKKRNLNMPSNVAKLRHANNGQVICLLRLLGATDSDKVSLQNHLAEVPTGEGKSVILGVLAMTLGLYGYGVDCVCYSGMLSSRDRDDFEPMFKSFSVTDQIRYGTFDSLSELLIKETHGDLRQMACDYISGVKCIQKQQAASHKRTTNRPPVTIQQPPATTSH